MQKYERVDDYINDQPSGTKEALISLKQCILTAAPDAIELFNYDIPAFVLIKNGKREQQIMIAGYKKHVGFYPHPTVIEKFSDRLANYKYSKGSVQFPSNAPIPCELVIEMVKYRRQLVLKDQSNKQKKSE